MSHIRKMYVFNPKMINEGASRAQALKMIKEGREEEVEIHKHFHNQPCAHVDAVIPIADTSELHQLPEDQCYKFTEATR